MSKFERIGLFGKSQSGKSTMMDRILRGQPRVILFDALPARAENASREGYVKIETMIELQEAVRRNYETGFRYWFKPENDEDFLVLALSDLSKFMIDHQDQYAAKYGLKNIADLVFAVDEMADCYPNHALPKKLNGFSKMCRSGRHSRIHLIGATQRPAEVGTKFRGQLEKRIFFTLTEPADLRAIADIGGAQGRMLAEAVSQLKALEYIRMENGTYTNGKLTFPKA
ncbi:MAG: hypothetical protein JKY60_20165 [Kordiimonadaceae bacterium]|nr:hypothetical protein [Kordiimonadaceae bacterium]